MKKDSLISGNIGKALLLFVLPLIAGSLIQQLYTTVDAVIVGQFTGKIGLAAIDSVHTLFKFPLNFMNGLATGATIMISRYFGAKKGCIVQCVRLFYLQVFWELSAQQWGLFFLHGCLILCLFQKKYVQDH